MKALIDIDLRGSLQELCDNEEAGRMREMNSIFGRTSFRMVPASDQVSSLVAWSWVL